MLIVGLAPAAHGGNRTGRVFTGDRSGDVLYASLWRTGLAAQPTSVTAGDGQRLLGARMVAAVRCAPPQNKPSVAERDACAPWLTAELELVADDVRVDRLPRPLRLAGDLGASWQRRDCWCHGPGRRSATAPRLWCARPDGERRAGAGYRLLSPEPAEHLYRPRDRRHAR